LYYVGNLKEVCTVMHGQKNIKINKKFKTYK